MFLFFEEVEIGWFLELYLFLSFLSGIRIDTVDPRTHTREEEDTEIAEDIEVAGVTTTIDSTTEEEAISSTVEDTRADTTTEEDMKADIIEATSDTIRIEQVN